MSLFDDFAKSITNLFFDSDTSSIHKTNINHLIIDLYVSIIRRMAEIDGEIAQAELHYYETMEAKLFNKQDQKLSWDKIPEPLYQKALKACKDKWNQPYTMAEIMSLTDGNPGLRRDLFEIACITAGADHKFVKTERKFLDLIALDFQISEDEKKKLMKLHHLA